MQRAWTQNERMACAVRFARARAQDYGGDPSWLTLFGHSGGANIAAIVAFADPEVPKGCVARSGSIVPQDLVLFEGEWLMAGDPQWDELLAEDPGVKAPMLPWAYVVDGEQMPVRVLASEYGPDLGFVEIDDPDAWMALRDPTGTLGREADRMGIFDDGVLDIREMQALLVHHLRALDYDATLSTLPASDHLSVSDEGMQVLIDSILQRT